MKLYIHAIAILNKQHRKQTIMYAHYALYDFLVVFKDEIKNGKWEIIRENPLIAKCEEENLIILDTMAIINKKLEEIGKMLGKPKLEMPKNPETTLEIEPYLKRDVEILYELLSYIDKMMQEMGVKVRTIWTTPQIAMKSFINWLTKTKKGYKILDIKGKEGCEFIRTRYDEFIRKAYRLGRNEAFQLGKQEELTYIDQNRQFPYSATIMEMPNLRKEYHLVEPLKWVKKEYLLNKCVGVCHAKMNLKNYTGIGLLPIKIREYEQIYPRKGIIKGYWTISEIREAEKEGYIIEDIYETVFYEKTDQNPFKDYFNTLYEQEQKEPKKKIIIKLLMNGLIGKLGTRIPEETTIIEDKEKWRLFKYQEYEISGEINGQFIYKRKKTKIPSYGNVMLATQIIATSRIQMYYWMKKVKEKDLIYTDTDSIIMKNWKKYEKEFPISKKMGDFKIEKDQDETEIINKEGEFLKEKMYKIGKTTKISGLNKREITDDILKRILDEKVKQRKMVGIAEAIRRGDLNLIGEFEEETFIKKGITKAEIELPDVIEE